MHTQYFSTIFHSSSHTKGSLHNLGGVKCQPFLKRSGYYVADLTPLNLTDSLETCLSLSFFALFQAISI